MYDVQSTPIITANSERYRIDKDILKMAQLLHQPPIQQPTDVKAAWLHPDDPLAVSVRKRTSKTSREGEQLEVEALDDTEGNLEKAAIRYNNCSFCRKEKQIVETLPRAAPPFARRYDDELETSSDDEDDEISLELKLYDQGPVFLANLNSNTTRRRGIARQESIFRTTPRGLATANEPLTNDAEVHREESDDSIGHAAVDYGFDDVDEDGEPEEPFEPDRVPCSPKAVYDDSPTIWRMMQPGQRLSTIYVKPATDCFDLTNASSGMRN